MHVNTDLSLDRMESKIFSVVQTKGNEIGRDIHGHTQKKRNEINRKNSIKQETIFPEHFSIVPDDDDNDDKKIILL